MPLKEKVMQVNKTDQFALHFQPRIYLAFYMAIAGFFTSNLLGELVFYIKHPGSPFAFNLSLLWPYYFKDFLILGTFFVPSYYLLPPRLSVESFQGQKAFWGGILAFFTSSLLQGTYSGFRTILSLNQATKIPPANEYSLPLIDMLIAVVPPIIIISLVIAPTGGIFAWLGYRFLYPEREKYWTQSKGSSD